MIIKKYSHVILYKRNGNEVLFVLRFPKARISQSFDGKLSTKRTRKYIPYSEGTFAE